MSSSKTNSNKITARPCSSRNMEERESVSCCSLFHVFLCPPCPRQITEKIIFYPPSPPSYELDLIDAQSGLYVFMLSPDVDTSGLKNILKQDCRFIRTSMGNDIAVLSVKCTAKKKFTILYSHGNAVDLGYIHLLCTELSLVTGCDIVSYDYSGYGQSSGNPTEQNMYADIKAAWDYTLTFHEPRPDKIVLHGQSLGCSPTLDLATKVPCAGVILQSAFQSALRVACPTHRFCACADKFRK